MVAETIFLLVFSWLIRSLFIFPQSMGVLSDSLAHLFMIRTQQNRSWFNYKFERAVIRTQLGYPKLQHFIISRFQPNDWFLVGARLIVLYDVTVVLLVYLLVSVENPWPDFELGMGSQAFWTALLFSTMPVLFSVKARLSGLGNARTFSSLFIFILLLVWYFADGASLTVNFAATLALMLLIIWSSFFGLQVAVLFAVFISLFSLDPRPFFCVAASIVVLFVLPVGAREILLHKYQHWVWYFRNYEKGTLPGTRNRLQDFKSLPRLLLTDRNLFANLVYNKLTPAIFVYSVPASFVLLYFFLAGQFQGAAPLIEFSLVVFWASLASFALISIKQLSFLGEAERYLEYAAAFISLLFVHLVAIEALPTEALLFLLLVHLTAVFSLLRYVRRTDYRFNSLGKLRTEEVNEVLNELDNDSDQELRILTLPTKAAFFWSFMCYNKRHIKFYQTFMGSNGGFRAMEEEMSAENWNYPVSDLEIFKDRYSINRVLMLKSNENANKTYRDKYELDDSKILIENQQYILFAI